MNNFAKKNLDDEIDLKKYFLLLWHGKFFIILTSFLAILCGSYYLQSAERKYTVEYKLKPVAESKNNTPLQGLGGLGGFASIAGIQFPSNTSNDFKIFKELMTSVEVSEIIFENKHIIRNIFKSEWNESINSFSRPIKNSIITEFVRIKKILNGNSKVKYMPPNARRLAKFISDNIRITEDKETGFLNITSNTSNPAVILLLITEAAKTSDNIMRQRYIDFSANPLAFYKKKLQSARSREHRENLAALISTEEQKLMFATRGEHFIAEPYLKPKIGLFPSSPKPGLILSLSLILGLFIGSVVILTRNATLKEN